jgi:hypothetical protein
MKVKPLLSGLLDREGPPPAGGTPYVRDYVLSVDGAAAARLTARCAWPGSTQHSATRAGTTPG